MKFFEMRHPPMPPQESFADLIAGSRKCGHHPIFGQRFGLSETRKCRQHFPVASKDSWGGLGGSANFFSLKRVHTLWNDAEVGDDDVLRQRLYDLAYGPLITMQHTLGGNLLIISDAFV